MCVLVLGLKGAGQNRNVLPEQKRVCCMKAFVAKPSTVGKLGAERMWGEVLEGKIVHDITKR